MKRYVCLCVDSVFSLPVDGDVKLSSCGWVKCFLHTNTFSKLLQAETWPDQALLVCAKSVFVPGAGGARVSTGAGT